MSFKHKNQNRLLLIRKKHGLGQKQIAALLGHKTIDQISRYERGVRMPNLKTALKLQIIYQLPINTLFQSYFNKCFDEIETKAKTSDDNSGFVFDLTSNTEFCTYIELLKPAQVSPIDMEKVGKHVLELMNTRTKRLGHR
jgi:transcriptional regulator with XRE-family HTH domain